MIDIFSGQKGGGARDLHGDDLCLRAVFGQGQGLGSDAAARLQDQAATGVRGVGVEQLLQSGRLILKAGALSRIIAVNVGIGHDRSFSVVLFYCNIFMVASGVKCMRVQLGLSISIAWF
jgi:hypothetical protein